MTPEAQRIAIAEACGWTRVPLREWALGAWKNPNGEGGILPDYLNDLNAMHEAETAIQCGRFGNYLLQLRGVVRRAHPNSTTDELEYDAIHATAAQRAEAFLRTIGRWEEGEQ